MNVKSILTSHSLDLIDAQVLLGYILNMSRADLYAFDDRELTESEYQSWVALSTRRLAGEPIAYLVGEKECFGLSFIVSPDVLIPRPDTECLIEIALEYAGDSMLDLGTGSGVIACAVASQKPYCQILATDISHDALKIAEQNVKRHHLSNITLRQSDGYETINETFDLIVSNPPYLAKNDLHLMGEIRFEPRGALVAELDGLAIIKRIIEGAKMHLNVGGTICIEHGFEQGSAVREIFKQNVFDNISTVKDLSGHERVTMARK